MQAVVKAKAEPGLWLEEVPVPEVSGDDVRILAKPYWIDIQPAGEVRKLAQLEVTEFIGHLLSLSKGCDLWIARRVKT